MKRRLKRYPLVSAVVLAGVLLSAAILAGACGSPASGVKTYTDADYGYSFQYPASWEVQEGDSADVTAGGSAAGSVGVYDPDGAVAGDTYIDLAQISVYKLNATIDDSMMPAIKTEVEAVLASLESQASDMKTVEALAETNTSGMSGFKVTYSFSKNGAPTTSTLYFLFSGNIEYQLTLQAADTNWEAKRPAFDALVASFKPGAAE
ncbi:MAG: PsbP-related protein [bacterium]